MNERPATVLLADPYSEDRRSLRDLLSGDGLAVEEAADQRSLLARLRAQLPDLIVLDLGLPGMAPFDVCRHIKAQGDVPIIVLTAVADEDTVLAALNLYAEDYILKPARNAEVAARIRRVLRRTWLPRLAVTSVLRVDDRLHLDFRLRQARTPGGVQRLTPLEVRLLQLLTTNAGQVLPTGLLLEQLWDDRPASTGSLWEYVRRVRRKIGDDGSHPRYILNEPGLGYRFLRSPALPLPLPGDLGGAGPSEPGRNQSPPPIH